MFDIRAEDGRSVSGRSNWSRSVVLFLLAVLVLPFVAACSSSEGEDEPGTAGDRPIKAVATIAQVSDIVRVVGGDRI